MSIGAGFTYGTVRTDGGEWPTPGAEQAGVVGPRAGGTGDSEPRSATAPPTEP